MNTDEDFKGAGELLDAEEAERNAEPKFEQSFDRTKTDYGLKPFLPERARDVMLKEADAIPVSPLAAFKDNTFAPEEKKRRTLRRESALRVLFTSDVENMTPEFAAGFYRSIHRNLVGLEDPDGSVAFGSRKSDDPKKNIEMLKQFCLGDHKVISSPERRAWMEMTWDQKFKYALEHETAGNAVGSHLKGDRGVSLGEMVAAGVRSGAAAFTPNEGRPTEIQKDVSRRLDYESMTPEEKRQYEADVIRDYDERLLKDNRLAAYLELTADLSDKAKWLVAKGLNDGECDMDALRQLRGAEPERALTAIKMARGNQARGHILGIDTDFSTGTAGDRLQMGLYGFQQGVIGLFADTYRFLENVGAYGVAKSMMDEKEFREFSDAMSFRAKFDQAFTQDLPEPESFMGEAYQGVMENLHWGLSWGTSAFGKGLMASATGIARPTLGATLKALATKPSAWKGVIAEYGKTLRLMPNAKLADMEKGLAKAEADFTRKQMRYLGKMMAASTEGKEVAKLANPIIGEYLVRQAAAVDRLRRDFASAKRIARWTDGLGAGLAATGSMASFATFAQEYMDNAVAAGVDWDDALVTSVAVGAINAKIENIWVPGIEGGLSRDELGMLTMASFRQALANTLAKNGKAGLKEYFANWGKKYLASAGRAAFEEGVVEEPLQQIVIEHGIAFDKLLKEYGYTGPTQVLKAFLPTADDWKTFVDTAIEMLPNDFGFALTSLPMAVGRHSRNQTLHNLWAKKWHYGLDERRRKRDYVADHGSLDGYEPAPMPKMYTETGELSPEMRRGAYEKVADLDYGVVDMIQRQIDLQQLVKDEWTGEDKGSVTDDPKKERGTRLKVAEKIQVARDVWRASDGTGDVVGAVADALGVGRRTAEVACSTFEAEGDFTDFNAKARTVLNANFVLASLTEADLKETNPNFVDGSFERDEKTGSVKAEILINMGKDKNGKDREPVRKTVVYRIGSSVLSEEDIPVAAARGSKFGDSWIGTHKGEIVNGRKVETWDELTDDERLEIVKRDRWIAKGSAGPGATVVFSDKDGNEKTIDADFLVSFATGRVGDIGYGVAAKRSTMFHENFHVLWDSVKEFIPEEDRKNLARKLDVDVEKGDWDSKLQEKMAIQLEAYSGGQMVPQFSQNVIEGMQGGIRGALGGLLEMMAPKTIDPKTGKEYGLKDFYDAVLRGDIGNAAELLKAAAGKMPEKDGGTKPSDGKLPGSVTEEELAAKDAETAKSGEDGAKGEEGEAETSQPLNSSTPQPSQPVVRRPSWDHGDRIDRKCPGRKWKLKCKLVLMSVHDLVTQQAQGRDVTAKDYKDRVDEMARTWEIEEGTKIDNTVLLGVPTAFTKDVVPGAVDRSVFAGNTRTSAILKIYENGGDAADAFRASQEQLAEERGLERAEGWENDPVVIALLEEVEVPGSEKLPTAQEIADASNGNIASAYGASESAGAHATILIANNLIPLFQIDLKTGEIIDNDEAYKTSRVNPIGEFYRKAGGNKALPDFYRKDTTNLSEDGQRILRNAILSALFGGRGGDTVARLMSEADRLGMQNEMAALMQLAPELLSLANDREHAKYDLRGPLVEALGWVQRWLDADEAARKSAGKTHAEWKRRKDGKPVEPAALATTWENFREGDMTEKPSEEAVILGDLLAAAHLTLAWSKDGEGGEERPSEASKLTARRLVTGYVRDYLENVMHATAPVEDGLFGGTEDAAAFAPPTTAEILRTQRGTRFSVGETLYHGSAADWRIPSLAYLGTGQGAAVEGYGINFTTDRDMADAWGRIARRAKEERGGYGRGLVGLARYLFSPVFRYEAKLVEDANIVDYHGSTPAGVLEKTLGALEKRSVRLDERDRRRLTDAAKVSFAKFQNALFGLRSESGEKISPVAAAATLIEAGIDGSKTDPGVEGSEKTFVVFNLKKVENVHQFANGVKRWSVAAQTPYTVTSEDMNLALSTFGRANSIDDAIYCLPDGTLLKGKGRVYVIGGKRIESFGHDGWIEQMHKALTKPDDDVATCVGKLDAVQRGVAKVGAIRIVGDKDGFTISHEPTNEQYDAIYDMAEQSYRIMESNGDDRLMIDVTDENLQTLFTLTYPRGTSARRIIDDLRGWYERGENPTEREQSALAEFRRYSIGSLYTGSAADYEKPSLLKVGTGEGSQVYGWGLYASSERGVAEEYSGLNGIKIDGKPIPEDTWHFARIKKAGSVEAAIRKLREDHDATHDRMADELELLKDRIEISKQHVYEQTFFTNRAPGDESHLLKWYEPVSEENKRRIADQLNREYGEKGFTWKWNGDSLDFASDKFSHLSNRHKAGNASELYARITTIVGGKPQAASEFLARADIDGIKYPVDSYGKTVKDGDKSGWNYVSFRDDNIRVDHKWIDGQQRFSVAARLNEEREAVEAKGGELLLAHHGTDRRGFTVFEKSDDIGYFFAKSRKTAASYIRKGQRGDEKKPGIPYYTDVLTYLNDEASGYTPEEVEAMSYDEKVRAYVEGTGEGSGIYDVALKMEDPYRIDCHGANWDAIYEIPDGMDQRTYDRVILDYNSITGKFGFWRRKYIEDRNDWVPGKEAGVDKAEFDDFESFRKHIVQEMGDTFAMDELEEIKRKAENDEGAVYSPVDGRQSKGPAGSMWTFDAASGEGWGVYPKKTREIVEDAVKMGCDGVIFYNVVDSGGGIKDADADDVYVVMKPEQVKSVDAMTYADDGSIIPAEKRLDWSNPDIRYSVDAERIYDGEYKFLSLPEKTPAMQHGLHWERDVNEYHDRVARYRETQRGLMIGSRKKVTKGGTYNGIPISDSVYNVDVGWPVYQMVRNQDMRCVNEPVGKDGAEEPISNSNFVKKTLKYSKRTRRSYYEVEEWKADKARPHIGTDESDPYHQQTLYFVAIGSIDGFSEDERKACAEKLIAEKKERFDALAKLVKDRGAESVVAPFSNVLDDAAIRYVSEKTGLPVGFSSKTAIVAFSTNAGGVHIELMKDAVMDGKSVMGVYAACHDGGYQTFLLNDLTPGKGGMAVTSEYGDAHKALARLSRFANPYWGWNELEGTPGWENLLNLLSRFTRAKLNATSGAELLAHMWNYGGMEEIAERIAEEAKRTARARKGKIASRKYTIQELGIVGGKAVYAAKLEDLQSGGTWPVMDAEGKRIAEVNAWEGLTQYGDILYDGYFDIFKEMWMQKVNPHISDFVDQIAAQLDPNNPNVHIVWVNDGKACDRFSNVFISCVESVLKNRYGKKYVYHNKSTSINNNDAMPSLSGEVVLLSAGMFTGESIANVAADIRAKFWDGQKSPFAQKMVAAAFFAETDGQLVLTESQLRQNPDFGKLSTTEINKVLGYDFRRVLARESSSENGGGGILSVPHTGTEGSRNGAGGGSVEGSSQGEVSPQDSDISERTGGRPTRQERLSIASRQLDWDALPDTLDKVIFSTSVQHFTGQDKVPAKYELFKQYRDFGHLDIIRPEVEKWAKSTGPLGWLGLYLKGKYYGDLEAARKVVRHRISNKRIGAVRTLLGTDNPVRWLYVRNDDGRRTNRLPQAYAEALAERFGGTVDDSIVKTSDQRNTSAGMRTRAHREFKFAGEPEKGVRYVIADDVWTTGQTTVSLLDYLVGKGADVRGITTLAVASHGDEVKPPKARLEAVLKKAQFKSVEEANAAVGLDLRKATGSELQAYFTGARANKYGFVDWFDPSANEFDLDFAGRGRHESGLMPPVFTEPELQRLDLQRWRERNASQGTFAFSVGQTPSEPLVRAMTRRPWRGSRLHGVDRDIMHGVDRDVMHGVDRDVRWSVGGTIDEAFPQLREMSDDELVIAAEAVRLALNTKGKGRFMNITRMQRDLRGLDPSQSHEDLGVRAVGVTQAARNLAKKMRADLDRGVSESKILAHLPDTMKEVFGSEMTARLRTGAKAGVYAERARKEIERRQEKVITDAVAIQSGVETKIMENAYGLDFSRTLMNLAENPYIRTDENGNRLPPERGEGEEGGADDEQSSGSAVKPVEAKVAEAVNEVARRAHELSEAEKAKKEELRRQAGRDAENQLAFNQEENAAAEDAGEGGGAMFTGDEDLVDVATRKAGVNLADPRELALFVSELSRKYWNDTHGLGNKPDTWNDPVAMQFLRKTAANIYTKLVNDLVYSQARDTATRAINRFENVPTARGLVSEMTFVGQLIHAKRMADTQREMCNKLDAFLKEKFGAAGRFSPDKEELRRTVSAEMELRARYTRHVIWLTPDALNDEIEAMRKNLHGVEVEFDDAGRDVDQSKVMVETLRKLQILREFGGLVYKPLAQIQAAIEYWEDALRGDTDRIVRDNYERDLLTEKAAAKLAAAFDNPKLKTALEKNWKSLANDYVESHMGFFVLLRDLMRFAPDDVRKDAEPIIEYLELAVQKAGTRAMSGKRRHGDALAQAVQSIYHRDFQKVLAEFNQRDDRFLEFMGEVSPGKKEIPTKGKAMQLFVSLLQVGHPVEVADKDGGSHVEWIGGYHDNIVKNHREGQSEKIRRLLSVEDLNLIAWLGKWYEANRENLSTVAEALFGIGVYAETANYMPVKMLLDPQGLEKGNAVGWTIFPRSLTPRIRNERDFDTSADILSMFMSRMEESEQWAAHAKLGLELRGIFGRSVLRKSLRANHGKSADQLVQGFITDILSGRGAGDLTTGKFSFYADRIRGMAALGALGGNLGVMLKQTTSIPAFGFEQGLAKTAKYILSAWSLDGFAAMREIFDSAERKNRWDVGNSEAVKNALSMNASGTLMKMLKASMITNKVGDVVPALVVGQGIYRDALAQGMSREDAMARTWMLIERTQQSSRLENQPEFVRRSRAARALFQFLTTQVQYLGYEAKAIREVMAKPGDVRRWGSLGSVLLLNHFLLSSLYYGMGQLWKRLLGQEPPPDDELADWMVTCLLGPFGALYVAGFTATEALNVWVKGKKFGSQPTLPSLSWASNIIIHDPGSVLSAIFSHDKGMLDDVLSAAGKWLADFNATFRDLRKVYRYRVKKEPQRK